MPHELNSQFNLVYMHGPLIPVSFNGPGVCTVPRPQDVDHYVHLEWFSGVLRSPSRIRCRAAAERLDLVRVHNLRQRPAPRSRAWVCGPVPKVKPKRLRPPTMILTDCSAVFYNASQLHLGRGSRGRQCRGGPRSRAPPALSIREGHAASPSILLRVAHDAQDTLRPSVLAAAHTDSRVSHEAASGTQDRLICEIRSPG